MKEIAIVGLYMLMPITCFAGATFLAYHKVDGWGWLILAGVLIGGSFKYTSG